MARLSCSWLQPRLEDAIVEPDELQWPRGVVQMTIDVHERSHAALQVASTDTNISGMKKALAKRA